MNRTSEGNAKAEELTERRVMVEQRSNYLKEIKHGSRLEPVMNEQVKPKFDMISQMCQTVKKLKFIPLDPCKCEVVIPPVVVKRETTLLITLRNENNNPTSDSEEDVRVLIGNISDDEITEVKPIKEVGEGRYEASFTARKYGYCTISIIVNGHHIPGSPYR